MLDDRRAFASAMAGEDEFVALAQTQAAFFQLPFHFAQHDAFVGCVQAFHFRDVAVAFDRLKQQPPFGDAAQRQAAQFGRVLAQRADHRLRVGIDPLRLQQDERAVIQLLHRAGAVQQADHRLQRRVIKAMQPSSSLFRNYLVSTVDVSATGVDHCRVKLKLRIPCTPTNTPSTLVGLNIHFLAASNAAFRNSG